MKHATTFSRAKIHPVWLALALIIILTGLIASTLMRTTQKNACYDTQLNAALRMAQAENVLLDHIKENNISITQEDINHTGLIGPEWTVLTTSLGLVEAKRTSLHPDFAALMVEYFEEAGLRAGDTVAVGASGSFPALVIATVCAANEMDLHTKIIASFGASMYGATRPELTVTKMLAILRDEKIIDYELVAVSAGGDNDQGGGGMFEETGDVIAALAKDSGVPYINEDNLAQSAKKRLELYGENVRCFVNVGGASANMGEGAASVSFPAGLTLDPPPIPTNEGRGLIFDYAALGVPVIHLLNIRKLAFDNGIPFDPVPLPAPGTSGVYTRTAHNVPILIGALALSIVVLAAARLLKRRE